MNRIRNTGKSNPNQLSIGPNMYKVIKQFSGGKSGDIVLRVNPLGTNKSFVLKLLLNQKNAENEIANTSLFYNIFSKYKISNPIIKPINYSVTNPVVTYQNKKYYYYMIEDLSVGYIPMENLIVATCLNAQTDPKIKGLFKNLFQVLKIMKLNFLSHCDLHSQNIFVHPNTLQLKIIDFGLSQKNKIPCSSQRSMTAVLIQNFVKCKKTARVLKELLSQKGVDSDVAMIVSMLSLYYTKPSNFIESYKNVSKQIFIAVQNGDIKSIEKLFDYMITTLEELRP